MASTDPFAASGGGTFVNGGWVPKNHPLAGSGTSTSGASPYGDLGKFSDTYSFTPTDTPGFTAPTYGTSTVAQPTYSGPEAFSYGQFTAPDASTIQNDPGFQFRLKQGVAARDASGAARGMVRSGNQLQALEQYGQGLASDEYGAAYSRAADTYARNFQTAKSVYDSSYQAAGDQYNRGTDAWNRDQGERQATFDNSFKSATAEYQPKLTDWQAKNLAAETNVSNNWNRGFDIYRYQNDDDYRRWADSQSSAYRYAALGQDASQFDRNLEERRSEFLANLGAGLV